MRMNIGNDGSATIKKYWRAKMNADFIVNKALDALKKEDPGILNNDEFRKKVEEIKSEVAVFLKESSLFTKILLRSARFLPPPFNGIVSLVIAKKNPEIEKYLQELVSKI